MECPRPPAALVPSLPRPAAPAVVGPDGSAVGSAARGRRRRRPPPRTLRSRLPAGYKLDRGAAGCCAAAAACARPAGTDPPLLARSRAGASPNTSTDRTTRPAAVEAERDGSAPGPSAGMVRMVAIVTMALLGAAAIVQVGAYALLLINRTMLLNPWVAGVATWLGVALSVLAAFAVVGERRGSDELADRAPRCRVRESRRRGPSQPVATAGGVSRPGRQSLLGPGVRHRTREDRGQDWHGCGRHRRLVVRVGSGHPGVRHGRSPPASRTDAQGIADNTVTTIIAYVSGLAALVLAARVYFGFERQPVDRPSSAGSWSPPSRPNAEARTSPRESPVAVESERREPAA